MLEVLGVVWGYLYCLVMEDAFSTVELDLFDCSFTFGVCCGIRF